MNNAIDDVYEWRCLREGVVAIELLLNAVPAKKPTPRVCRNTLQYLRDDWVIARLAQALFEALTEEDWREPLLREAKLFREAMSRRNLSEDVVARLGGVP